MAKHFVYINFAPEHVGSSFSYYLHFTNEDTESERLSNFPKNTIVHKNDTKIQTRAVRFKSTPLMTSFHHHLPSELAGDQHLELNSDLGFPNHFLKIWSSRKSHKVLSRYKSDIKHMKYPENSLLHTPTSVGILRPRERYQEGHEPLEIV